MFGRSREDTSRVVTPGRPGDRGRTYTGPSPVVLKTKFLRAEDRQRFEGPWGSGGTWGLRKHSWWYFGDWSCVESTPVSTKGGSH